jgi:hypothetical protein
MMYYDPLTRSKPRDALAHFDDGSSHLMSEDAGRGMGASMNFFQISATDAAGGYLDQKFSRPNLRHRHSFDAHVIHAAIDDGLHGSRNLTDQPGLNV